MKNFHQQMHKNKTFPLMVYMIWMLLPTDGKTIRAKLGSSVTLQCNETSIDSLSLLTWKMNGTQDLYTFKPRYHPHVFPEARNLSLKMSNSVNQLYALIIESAQEFHTGNYTCETTTPAGIWKQEWELLITAEDAGKLSLPVMVVVITVPCVTILTFIIALICMLTVCRHRAKNCSCSHTGDTQEQTEDIYENCFDNRHYIRPPQTKPRTYSDKA